MATLTDRPKQKTPAQREPAETPRRSPEPPIWTDSPSRPPEPNRRRDRLLACLYLFGPGAALVLAALTVIAVALALALGGSGDTPPATGAAELVPGNALLYVHFSTDPARPAVSQALALSRRVPGSPLLFAALTTRLDAILGGSANPPISFADDVKPWLGKEAALAVLDTPGASAGTLMVLDVRNHPAARRFLARVGAQPDGSFRGVALFAQRGGTVLAFVRHYLVLGQPGSVESAIYVADGKAPSLTASRQYQGAAASEPAGRVFDAYASADGVSRALAPRSGLLGDLGALLGRPGLSATALSVSPVSGGLQVEIHSSLIPKLARGASRAPAPFTPTLSAVLPAGSMLLLDAKGLRTSVPSLLGVATRAGALTRVAPLLSRLGGALAAAGVNLRQVLGVFSGETAIAVTPADKGSGPVPVIVTRTAHMASTRAILANLEAPLTQVFSPPADSPGQVPEVTDTSTAGVSVHELSLAPGFGLDYAVARGLVVVSTGLSGITQVFRHAAAMNTSPSFQSGLANTPSRVTSLVFFDLSQLLRLGEQTGLIASAQPVTLGPALDKIHAVGLESWRGADDTTTQIQIQIP
ncbi:MAG TPA: DUF3352 domain-containing protein [Solirubrobacteraceae bacterium]|nr:DUF3352 domain-containing protein [Solirubrobacteraceae bacterium]